MTKAELISEIKSLTNAACAHPIRETGKDEKIAKKTSKKVSKQWQCLYEFMRLTKLYGMFSENLFPRLVNLIPPAFQFPKITCARILVENREFKTKNFRESSWNLKQEIYVHEHPFGVIEVNYLKEKPSEYQGPFFNEEVSLIHALSEYLGILTKCREMDRDRRVLNDRVFDAKLEAICKLSRGMAHDFNNFLTVINGYSRYMLDHLDNSNPIYPDINEINKAGNLGAEAIKRLVGFSGNLNPNVQCFDLNSFVLDLKVTLDSMLGNEIDLVINSSDLSTTIRLDKGELTQVLFSLTQNAKEAMPKGGKLTIAVSNVVLGDVFCDRHKELKPGYYIILRLSDTGDGIPPDLVRGIFDPLYTTKRKRMGVGLGLATAQKIIRQNGGYMTVHSKLNKGTDFVLFFPFYEAESTPDSTKTGSRFSHYACNETLVMVDNDKMLCDLLKKF